MWIVYIIQAKSGKLYTGITTDIKKRFAMHASKKGAKYFRTEIPEKVVFCMTCENRSQATKEEMKIKKMARIQKLELISNNADKISL